MLYMWSFGTVAIVLHILVELGTCQLCQNQGIGNNFSEVMIAWNIVDGSQHSRINFNSWFKWIVLMLEMSWSDWEMNLKWKISFIW